MDGTIKIRFPEDMWWSTISLSNAIKWLDLDVSYLTDKVCFIRITDANGSKTTVELYRDDYEKIMNEKAFRIKFNLRKHEIT